MSENRLAAVFRNVQIQYFNTKLKKLEVKFHPFRSLKHTMEWTPWRIRIKVNDLFTDAPDEILENLAIILLAKVYNFRVGKEIRNSYNQYVDSLKKSRPTKRHNHLDFYTAQGTIYNLNAIFEHLNKVYFHDSLTEPTIGWSRQKSYWRLGFYDKERNLLVISRIFDQSTVPEKIVIYLVYHEMLHLYFPSERKNGRRIIHSTQFRKTEQQYPEYQSIQKWLKSNVRKL